CADRFTRKANSTSCRPKPAATSPLVPGHHGKGESGARRPAKRNVALDPAPYLVPAEAEPSRDEPFRARRYRILEDDLHLDRPRPGEPCRRGVQPPNLVSAAGTPRWRGRWCHRGPAGSRLYAGEVAVVETMMRVRADRGARG